MTPYQNIYDIFEGMITDYDLNDLIPENKAEVELRLLKQAISTYFSSSQDLSQRDDATFIFNIDISEIKQQILANYMVMAWVKPYLNNQDLFETHFSTSEYNAFSSANKMRALKETFLLASSEAGRLATKQSIKEVLGGLG